MTSDPRKGYLISEFGGQQLPTKPFDDETHRLVQALRYAAGINDSIAQQGVAGSLAGAWPITTPTGNLAAATASATTV